MYIGIWLGIELFSNKAFRPLKKIEYEMREKCVTHAVYIF